jgi:hypothetical protein
MEISVSAWKRVNGRHESIHEILMEKCDIGSILSYGATLLLFLPCLFLVSRVTSVTAILTGLIGTVLGCIVYVPIAWQSYLASGVDSGPPTGTFQEYLWLHGFEWDFWFVVLVFIQPIYRRKQPVQQVAPRIGHVSQRMRKLSLYLPMRLGADRRDVD